MAQPIGGRILTTNVSPIGVTIESMQRRLEHGVRPAGSDPYASSTHTGTWSEGFSQLRVNLSMPAPCSRSAACGESSM